MIPSRDVRMTSALVGSPEPLETATRELSRCKKYSERVRSSPTEAGMPDLWRPCTASG